MRKKIVAGNWKMHTTLEVGIKLAREVEKLVVEKADKNVVVIIGVPFTHLTEAVMVVNAESVKVAAQNCCAEPKGAFTGEVSAEMIKSTGAGYVIIGHSERRSYYHEDDAILNKKVKLALSNGLIPIFCIGEVLAERNANQHFEVVKTQLVNGLFNLESADFQKIVIAYEPVWAIGTGLNATPEQAQEMHKYIRTLLGEKYGKQIADDTSILYGGSCKPSNSVELFANPDVDGGLIGGASLKAEDFLGIINSFKIN
jgi:triosephosphate isomerase